MTRVFIPIVRYVGGEDYEVVDREIRDTDADRATIDGFLRHHGEEPPSFFAEMTGHPRGSGPWLKERRRCERFDARTTRRLWLLRNRRTAS